MAAEDLSLMNTPQPPPTPSSNTPVWDLVLTDVQDFTGPGWDLVRADMHERDVTCARKYGCHLTAGNGRVALIDAYQEGLDLIVYLRQDMEDHPGDKDAIVVLYREALLIARAARVFIRERSVGGVIDWHGEVPLE